MFGIEQRRGGEIADQLGTYCRVLIPVKRKPQSYGFNGGLGAGFVSRLDTICGLGTLPATGCGGLLKPA
jgi:hypothetical protein